MPKPMSIDFCHMVNPGLNLLFDLYPKPIYISLIPHVPIVIIYKFSGDVVRSFNVVAAVLNSFLGCFPPPSS